MKKVHTNKGFTLAELLIVVAVIAVLVAVAIPTFGDQLEKSRQAVDVSNLRGAYAAGRLAEMDGGVNGIKFDSNKANMKVGTSDEIDEEKFYAAYWYDPDTGKLALIDATSTTEGEKTTYSLTEEKATEHFQSKTQKGKAQGTTVVADTSQLPGEGKSLVVYDSAQLKRTDDTSQGGTLDRAIRVVFFKTYAGAYKLHEIAFVAKSDEPLVNAVTSGTLVLEVKDIEDANFKNGTYYTGQASNKNFNIDIAKYYTVDGADFDTNLYTLKLATADDASNFDGDITVNGTTVIGKLGGREAAATSGTITLLVVSTEDPTTITGTATLTVQSRGKPSA